MSISFDKALGMNEQAMLLRTDRANVLSSNLANADTPNYKARDIDFHAALQSQVSQGSVGRAKPTHSGHMQIANLNSTNEMLYRVPSQPSIDGNTVEGHVEHAEFMKNSMEFQVAFQLLNGSFKGLRKAIRGE